MSCFSDGDKFQEHNENSYDGVIQSFIPKDAYTALGFYCFYLLTVILAAVLVMHTEIYIGIFTQVLSFIVCILLVKTRKQSLASLGISSSNLLRNSLWGIVLGLLFIAINIWLLNNYNKIQNLNLMQIFYHFIPIAFIEEITFRGYIQSRVCILIKNRMSAVLFVGILSAIVHIPFDIVNSEQGILKFIVSWNFLAPFATRILAHIILYHLYRKFNSFIPATILHGMVNLLGHKKRLIADNLKGSLYAEETKI